MSEDNKIEKYLGFSRATALLGITHCNGLLELINKHSLRMDSTKDTYCLIKIIPELKKQLTGYVEWSNSLGEG